MTPCTVIHELAVYGPKVAERPAPSLAEAQTYCRQLARTHYENFTVVSWLLPRRLQQNFANIYAYCRWADDLADETGSPGESLALLDWWQTQLAECYRGQAQHPVFVALAETVREFAIPEAPFLALLTAFRRDQDPRRYATFAELIEYCRGSANPVGHLVLYLGHCHNDRTAALSDSICTGLQLANFWQDVARDYARGRIYLPEDSCAQFGYDATQFASRTANDAFRQLLAFEVERAERYLQAGRPLVDLVTPELRLDVDLFIRGGLAVLAAIRHQNYDVWRRRPTVGKLQKARLFAAAWWRQRRGFSAPQPSAEAPP